MSDGFIRASTREEWLANRKCGIGASEVAAILGINPYQSAFSVWAEKTGNAEPEDLSDNECIEFGLRLEVPIADAYAARSGRSVSMWSQYRIAKHAEHDWLRCTPDATQVDDVRGPGLLQIKTTDARNAYQWKDEPPLYYQVQCQIEMEVMNDNWSTLVCLIGGNRLRYFDLDRNQRFIDSAIPVLSEFRARVLAKEPPSVDDSVATAKALARMHPNDNGEVVRLSDRVAEWAETLERCKAEIAELEKSKIEAENNVKAAIGSATIGLLPDGSKYSWKTQTRKAHQVAESTFRVLRRMK